MQQPRVMAEESEEEGERAGTELVEIARKVVDADADAEVEAVQVLV